MNAPLRNPGGYLKRYTKDRMAEKLANGSVPGAGGCRLWQGATIPSGYGQTRGPDGKAVAVHRLAYELEHGPIPEGLHVLHRCDVRNCICLDHLFLGTHDANMKDRHAKGRYDTQPKGEDNPAAKLTEAVVLEIRRKLDAGVKSIALAREYGLHRDTISKIKRRIYWAHLGPC